jgi:hypothetical protein
VIGFQNRGPKAQRRERSETFVEKVIPKLDALPKLTAFQCLKCREVITVEGDG